MEKTVPVRNLTGVKQVFGRHILPPHGCGELPLPLAATVAAQEEFQCESTDLLGHYRFICEDGTYLGWCSPFYYADGYGSVAQEIAAAMLDRLGVSLSIYPRDYSPSDRRFGGVALDQWEERAFVPHSIVECLRRPQVPTFYGINNTWPRDIDKHPFPRAIGFTTFETTMPPVDWVPAMNRCRRLVVPCRQNKEAFIRAGVTVPIHVTPLGANPEKWPAVERSPSPMFTFLMSAGLTHRKNPAGAARAFVRAFPHQRDVRLILKTRGEQTAHKSFWSWSEALPRDDRILVIREESTPTEMWGWMARADAFVFPSHGEGFGLTSVQAMCTGLPVIVSDNSGMSDYCDDRYNYPVECREVKVPREAGGGYPDHWGNVGNWWDPVEESLIARFREVYEDQEGARRKGMAAAGWVRRQWTIERTARMMLDVVVQDAREDGLI